VQQVRLGVEVDVRLAQEGADLLGEGFELGWAATVARPLAEEAGEQLVVRLDAPRQAVVPISAAISAPVDSAASSRRRRPGAVEPATAASCRASSSGTPR